ncbi:DNA gyrase subunit A [Oceanivirga miroungae]|uniref:DNA gyrase subunit A n=2 Tax=Oceanivirga miroungae TaxID=1130046 RepID=A0A6I8M8V7_9FUSO|nr:DNA gyrase subunit A [Oceanivirga miroungae]VWL85970.1 DNA gyrase subunit alpha [Oceanivirga miroungae]
MSDIENKNNEDIVEDKILPIFIEDEIKASYLDYSMSVIVSRALPDVRDGLKPVHRRILFAMNELGMTYDKAFKKSARIVGEVLGKYHPHGDSAVYNSMVRMAQEFNTRYMLIDGHGNFGSIDGDSAAAMRYTEARMSKVTNELLEDINKNTIDFRKNFDETLDEPVVLPAKLPNLLLNGATGIAVGMATNIPPHNLAELCDGIVALIDDRNITIDGLMEHIKAPDFPTGGIINGRQGIIDAYKTGRGKIQLVGKVDIKQTKSGKNQIIITEIPYQVNKAKLIEKIADLVRQKKITGISELRDESDRDGIRIVVGVKKGEEPELILNMLYKYTDLQTTFGIIMLALVKNVPRILNLKQILNKYLEHRYEVITRRTEFDLEKAKRRAHILEGFRIALDSIDEIIALLRSSKDPGEAKERLMSEFGFSELQAKAILDMRMQRLTGLEREKIEQEYNELLALITDLQSILDSDQKKYDIIREEVIKLKTTYSDNRRTSIEDKRNDIDIEDLIKEEEVVVTITNKGYVKRVSADTYKLQKRGGVGVNSTNTIEDDEVKNIYTVKTLDRLLVFSDKGKVYNIKVYEIPEASSKARGKLIGNIIDLDADENVSAILSVANANKSDEIFFLTRLGIAKKTKLDMFENINKNGKIAISLKDDDELVFVALSSGKDDEVFVATIKGMAIRFKETDVRSMGRTAGGVKAIKLRQGDKVSSACIIDSTKNEKNLEVLTVSTFGFGKRTKLSEYSTQKRGGTGVKNFKISAKTGDVVESLLIDNSDEEREVLIITKDGTLIKTRIKQISTISRYTSGVIVIKPRLGDYVSSVALSMEVEEEEEKENE